MTKCSFEEMEMRPAFDFSPLGGKNGAGAVMALAPPPPPALAPDPAPAPPPRLAQGPRPARPPQPPPGAGRRYQAAGARLRAGGRTLGGRPADALLYRHLTL